MTLHILIGSWENFSIMQEYYLDTMNYTFMNSKYCVLDIFQIHWSDSA